MSIKCDFRFDSDGGLVYAFVVHDRAPVFKDKVYAKSIILEEQAQRFFSKQIYKLLPDYVDLRSVEILSKAAFDAFLHGVFAAQIDKWSLDVGCDESALFIKAYTEKKPKIRKFVPVDLELAVSSESYASIASAYENIVWCADFLRSGKNFKLTGAEIKVIDLLSESKLCMPMCTSEGYEGAEFLIASRFFDLGEDWPKQKASQSYPLLQISRDALCALSGIDCQGDKLQILNFKNDKQLPLSRVIPATDAKVPSGVAKDVAACNRKYEWMDGGIRCANGYAVMGILPVEIQSDISVSDFFKLKKHIPAEHELRFSMGLHGLLRAQPLNDYAVCLDVWSKAFGISVSGRNISLMSEKQNVAYDISISMDVTFKSSTRLIGYPY